MVETKKLMWMVKKEWLSLKRHPSRLISILVFPIIMILLFGYGMGGDLSDLPIVVVSQSNGDLTDMTLETIKTNDIYHVVKITNNVNEAKDMVDKGDVKAAIILPSDYDSDTSQQKSVTFYLDSSDQMATQSLVPTTQAIFSQISLEQASAMATQSTNSTIAVEDADTENSLSSSINSFKSSITLHINKIYGDIKYIDFLVPAVLGMTVMMSCMMGMGASIAGERETGELARLFMTPTSVATVIGGKILGKLSVEFLRAMILLSAAILLFGATVNGGILPTIIVLIIGALCFVGFGIMMSARASTQEDYSQMVMPFSMPMMFVSGVFYPVETMPWIFQQIAYICPLTYLNDAMRAIMLKGQTLGDVWFELLVLIGFTIFFFALGVKRFNRDV
ncbi:ABC transporter permease [Methanobrevibacter sp. OttesenSCG-928-K11]|nr:ABC transporter permease [Methanobrevibacter sp. OttesenSCG-928-K11]MDL2270453.1 ABC transporter permease [Methanobrevibacter sp. OttesenSCG-928-I08]